MSHTPNKSKPPSLLDAFLEHKSVLAAYIAQRVIRNEDVDDILQEAFIQLKLANARETLRSPKSYLFIVARNILSKQLTRDTKYRLAQLEEVEASCIGPACGEPDKQLHSKLKLEAFNAAVESLPPQCKRVFLLRKMKGLSHRNIGDALGISKSTVERHITLAMSRLSSEMRQYGYGDSKKVRVMPEINSNRSKRLK